jgi:hypothetical protein
VKGEPWLVLKLSLLYVLGIQCLNQLSCKTSKARLPTNSLFETTPCMGALALGVPCDLIRVILNRNNNLSA